jgi:hypothetical protein
VCNNLLPRRTSLHVRRTFFHFLLSWSVELNLSVTISCFIFVGRIRKYVWMEGITKVFGGWILPLNFHFAFFAHTFNGKNHVFIPMLRGMKHVGLHGTLSRWMVMVVEWLLSLLNPFPMSMMKYHNLLFKMLNNSETEREREGRNVGRISYFYVHYCPYVLYIYIHYCCYYGCV